MTGYVSETDSRHFAILDAAGHAVIATDTAGSIGYWNGAAERLYGWDREEVIGRNIVEVTPTDQSRDESLAIMKLLAAGDLWSGVFSVRDRQGRRFDAAVTDIPIRKNGTTVAIVGVSAENTASADLASTLSRFAVRQRVQIRFKGPIERATAHASEPHLIQLFTILLLKFHDEADGAEPRVWIAAERSTPKLRMDFGIASAQEWVYLRFSPDSAQGRSAAIRDALRHIATTRYGSSLVDLAGGRLFTATSPRSGPAFHLFLPVN